MTTYYLDSSALVKRYVNETDSAWVRSLCEPASGHVIALAHIGLVEIAAVLSVKHRQGALTEAILEGILWDLQRDGREQYWLVDVDQQLVVRAIALTRRQKLRGYDAVHLASALFLQETLASEELPAPVLLSADQELLAAAHAEGMLTDDPHVHL